MEYYKGVEGIRTKMLKDFDGECFETGLTTSNMRATDDMNYCEDSLQLCQKETL